MITTQDPAADDPTETLNCPQCNSTNPLNNKFCADCGSNLRAVCVRCGATIVTDTRFCGDCGADVLKEIEVRGTELEGRLKKARLLELDFRFDEAIALLSLNGPEHPSLRDFFDRIRRLRGELATARDRQKAEANRACIQAHEHLSGGDFETAEKCLSEVPRAIHTANVEKLLVEARAKVEEVGSLTLSIESAFRTGQLLEALPAVRRLLKLRPDYPAARDLAARVGTQLCRAADEQLGKHQYDAALNLLEHLPEAAMDSRAKELRQRAVKLSSLCWAFRHAPYVDNTLVAIARLFSELAPGYPNNRQALTELNRRFRQSVDQSRYQPVAWAAPPKQTPFGCPVDWMTGFGRLQLGKAVDRSVLKRNPGAFPLACGLALQGLGMARVTINLLPKEGSRSMLRRVARAGRNKTPAGTAWGIDIGASGLKAVKLRSADGGAGAVVEEVALVEHPRLLAQTLGVDQTRAVISDTMKEFLAGRKLKGAAFCLSLPCLPAIYREIVLPPIDSSRVGDAMEYEVRHQIPFDPDAIIWRHYRLDRGESGQTPARATFLIVAVRRMLLEEHLETFHKLGIRPDLVQTRPIGLHNLLAYEHFPEHTPDSDAPSNVTNRVIGLDMGVDDTMLVLSAPNSVRVRHVPIGGRALTEALAQDLETTVSEAELVKRDPTRAAPWSKFENAVNPILGNLVAELQAAVKSLVGSEPARQPASIRACGRGLFIHGALRHLRTGR